MSFSSVFCVHDTRALPRSTQRGHPSVGRCIMSRPTSESWHVNRYTARCTSPVSVVWQWKLVSCWGLMKRRSAPLYGPYGSGSTLRFHDTRGQYLALREGFTCLCIRLSVCLWAGLHEKLRQIWQKFSEKVRLDLFQRRLDFGGDPGQHLDPGNDRRILYHCQIGQTYAEYSVAT